MKSIVAMIAVYLSCVPGVGIHTVAADSPDQHQAILEQHEFIEQQNELTTEHKKEMHQDDLELNQSMQQISRASKIIGSFVKSPNGDYLGTINELVIDPTSGQLVYAVVSFGGLLGLRSKLFAVPWQALHWSGDKGFYNLDLDKTILTSSPGFNHKHWPDTSNLRDLQREVLNQFYFDKP
jgi:sporulation protein YlmC with PRC-barrel domain